MVGVRRRGRSRTSVYESSREIGESRQVFTRVFMRLCRGFGESGTGSRRIQRESARQAGDGGRLLHREVRAARRVTGGAAGSGSYRRRWAAPAAARTGVKRKGQLRYGLYEYRGVTDVSGSVGLLARLRSVLYWRLPGTGICETFKEEYMIGLTFDSSHRYSMAGCLPKLDRERMPNRWPGGS